MGAGNASFTDVARTGIDYVKFVVNGDWGENSNDEILRSIDDMQVRDTTAPAAYRILPRYRGGDGTVSLRWTSPGDTGSIGTLDRAV